jgi:hypothetical protein
VSGLELGQNNQYVMDQGQAPFVRIVIPNVCEESFFSDVLLSFILSTEKVVCLITFFKNKGQALFIPFRVLCYKP